MGSIASLICLFIPFHQKSETGSASGGRGDGWWAWHTVCQKCDRWTHDSMLEWIIIIIITVCGSEAVCPPARLPNNFTWMVTLLLIRGIFIANDPVTEALNNWRYETTSNYNDIMRLKKADKWMNCVVRMLFKSDSRCPALSGTLHANGSFFTLQL